MSWIHWWTRFSPYLGCVAISFMCALVTTVSGADSYTQTAVSPGDVHLAAILPVHHRSLQTTGLASGPCGDISEAGVMAVERFFYALEKINRDAFVLPRTMLGGVVKDSCSTVHYATTAATDIAQSKQRNIAGVVGPSSVVETIAVQNLLRTFRIPQISYSAKTSFSDDPSRFPYLVRVAPSVRTHARALVDILLRYNWSYVSIITSEDMISHELHSALEVLLKENGICVAAMLSLQRHATTDQCNRVVEHLRNHPRARVVVCLCDADDIRALLLAVQRRDVAGTFTFVGATDWVTRPEIVRGVEKEAVGGISVSEMPHPDTRFAEHFRALRPEYNSRNPWFREYWQHKFSCRLDGDIANTPYSKQCTGNETLSEFEGSFDSLHAISTAVKTLAYAVSTMTIELCGDHGSSCEAIEPINGEKLLAHIKKLNFVTNGGERIHFDKHGDLPGRYIIYNYQEHTSGYERTYRGVPVGTWNDTLLELNERIIQWPGPTSGNVAQPIPKSTCSDPCPSNHRKATQVHGDPCCWICVKSYDEAPGGAHGGLTKKS